MSSSSSRANTNSSQVNSTIGAFAPNLLASEFHGDALARLAGLGLAAHDETQLAAQVLEQASTKRDSGIATSASLTTIQTLLSKIQSELHQLQQLQDNDGEEGEVSGGGKPSSSSSLSNGHSTMAAAMQHQRNIDILRIKEQLLLRLIKVRRAGGGGSSSGINSKTSASAKEAQLRSMGAILDTLGRVAPSAIAGNVNTTALSPLATVAASLEGQQQQQQTTSAPTTFVVPRSMPVNFAARAAYAPAAVGTGKAVLPIAVAAPSTTSTDGTNEKGKKKKVGSRVSFGENMVTDFQGKNIAQGGDDDDDFLSDNLKINEDVDVDEFADELQSDDEKDEEDEVINLNAEEDEEEEEEEEEEGYTANSSSRKKRKAKKSAAAGSSSSSASNKGAKKQRKQTSRSSLSNASADIDDNVNENVDDNEDRYQSATTTTNRPTSRGRISKSEKREYAVSDDYDDIVYQTRQEAFQEEMRAETGIDDSSGSSSSGGSNSEEEEGGSNEEDEDGNKKSKKKSKKKSSANSSHDHSSSHIITSFPSTVIPGGLNLPNYIHRQLLPYQLQGVSWLYGLYRDKVGGILGDEMGLGKTVQVAALLGALQAIGKLRPSIIVCPATIITHWVRELTTWWPPLRVFILHESGGASRAGAASINANGGAGGNGIIQARREMIRRLLQQGNILITTYEGIRVHSASLMPHSWGYVILDEGHRIRNPEAAITQLLKQIHSQHRLILTGAPIQNRLRELWSLLDFAYPGRLGTLQMFESQFAGPISAGGWNHASAVAVQTAYQCAVVLRDLISPYLLRRLKRDVNAQLPSKTEQVLFCRLAPAQRGVYSMYLRSQEVANVLTGRAQAFRAITILRKICNHPRLLEPDEFTRRDAVEMRQALERSGSGGGNGNDDDDDYSSRAGSRSASSSSGRQRHQQQQVPFISQASGKMAVAVEILRLWHGEGRRVLLFAQGRQMLDILESHARASQYSYLRMDGSTSVRERQPLVDAFNTNPKWFLFLLTTRVGGVGVNLTGADRVLIYDPDWNPSTDAQARERAWRLGQRRHVTIYRLITAGTIEEKIYHRQIFKTALTQRILSDPRAKRTFSYKDLKELFTLTDGGPVGGMSDTAILAPEGHVDLPSAAKTQTSGSSSSGSRGISGRKRGQEEEEVVNEASSSSEEEEEEEEKNDDTDDNDDGKKKKKRKKHKKEKKSKKEKKDKKQKSKKEKRKEGASDATSLAARSIILAAEEFEDEEKRTGGDKAGDEDDSFDDGAVSGHEDDGYGYIVTRAFSSIGGGGSEDDDEYAGGGGGRKSKKSSSSRRSGGGSGGSSSFSSSSSSSLSSSAATAAFRSSSSDTAEKRAQTGVLQALVDGGGLSSVFSHDALEGATNAGSSVTIAAKRIAQEALKALQSSAGFEDHHDEKGPKESKVKRSSSSTSIGSTGSKSLLSLANGSRLNSSRPSTPVGTSSSSSSSSSSPALAPRRDSSGGSSRARITAKPLTPPPTVPRFGTFLLASTVPQVNGGQLIPYYGYIGDSRSNSYVRSSNTLSLSASLSWLAKHPTAHHFFALLKPTARVFIKQPTWYRDDDDDKTDISGNKTILQLASPSEEEEEDTLPSLEHLPTRKKLTASTQTTTIDLEDVDDDGEEGEEDVLQIIKNTSRQLVRARRKVLAGDEDILHHRRPSLRVNIKSRRRHNMRNDAQESEDSIGIYEYDDHSGGANSYTPSSSSYSTILGPQWRPITSTRRAGFVNVEAERKAAAAAAVAIEAEEAQGGAYGAYFGGAGMDTSRWQASSSTSSSSSSSSSFSSSSSGRPLTSKFLLNRLRTLHEPATEAVALALDAERFGMETHQATTAAARIAVLASTGDSGGRTFGALLTEPVGGRGGR